MDAFAKVLTSCLVACPLLGGIITSFSWCLTAGRLQKWSLVFPSWFCQEQQMSRVLDVGSVNFDHLVKLASARFLCSEATDFFSVIRTSWEAALGWCRCLVTSHTPSRMILVLRDAVPCDLRGSVLEILCVYLFLSYLWFSLPLRKDVLPSLLVCLYQCDPESHL